MFKLIVNDGWNRQKENIFPYVIKEAALLVEMEVQSIGCIDSCDCPERIRIEQVMKRDEHKEKVMDRIKINFL